MVISRLYKGLQGLIKSRKITYVNGYGKLISQNSIMVNGEVIEGKNIVLATGSTTKTLPNFTYRR